MKLCEIDYANEMAKRAKNFFNRSIAGRLPVYVKYTLFGYYTLPYTLLYLTILFLEESYRAQFLTDLHAQWSIYDAVCFKEVPSECGEKCSYTS